jgi:hypothetical protein
MQSIQTCPYPIIYPAYSRDHCTPRSLRTLLQELPFVHANTRLRDKPRYIARPNAATRLVRVHTARIIDNPRRSS